MLPLSSRRDSSRLVIVAWCLLSLSCLNYLRVVRNHYRAAPTTTFTGRCCDQQHGRRLEQTDAATLANSTATRNNQKLKILYIITSLNEYDNGRRETLLGYDRFNGTLLPVVRESMRSFRNKYKIDLYLIAQYTVSPQRIQQLRHVLPHGVGLQIWDDATPLGYAADNLNGSSYLQPISRALARQHRYVVKDKLSEYDVFVNFEDDMMVKVDHVDHYVRLTQELYQMRQSAPDKLEAASNNNTAKTIQDAQQAFYGAMTKIQLERLVPGFVRVEAALDNYHPHLRNRQPQIPLDYDWNDTTMRHAQVNASICCHVSEDNEHIPLATPTAEQLFFWETAIEALGVRQLPNTKWALLLGGNSEQYYADANFVIGDYWTGRGDAAYFGAAAPRPDKTKSLYMSNQGGWMATRRQIVEWHGRWCRGGFLPPFQMPHHASDGLATKTVEYWSGGIQIAGVLGCNLQRVVMLEPDDFSKHLLYHSSNNKQKVKNVQYRFSSRSIQEFWGQLNTIRKNAEKAIAAEKTAN